LFNRPHLTGAAGGEHPVDRSNGAVPSEFAKPAVLSGYCERGAKMPIGTSQIDTNHLQVLRGIAAKAKEKDLDRRLWGV
jgi:hypothetical protein